MSNRKPLICQPASLMLFLLFPAGLFGQSPVISGPDFVCPGAIVSYSVEDQAGTLSYVWSFPPDVSVVEQNGSLVTVLWGISNGNICVTINYDGGTSEYQCLSVDVPPNVAPTTLDSTICEGEFVFFGGEILTQEGTYTTQMADQFGCDSTIILSLEVLPTPIEGLLKQDATCSQDNGTAEVVFSDGVTPFLIQWSTGAINTEFIDGLAPGVYSVTVSSGDCADDASIEIKEDPFCEVLVSGFLFDDQLAQACEETQVEGGVEQVLLRLTSPTDSWYTLSDQNGYYEFLVDTGQYELELILPQDKALICPATTSRQLTFPKQGSYSDTNHFFLAEAAFEDLSADALIPFAKAGTQMEYELRFCNNGTDTASGRFILEYDPEQIWIGAELMPSITDNIEKKVIWDLMDLSPGECLQFSVTMALPSDLAVGTNLQACTRCLPIGGSQDEWDENDRFCWSQPVLSARPAFEKRGFSGPEPYGQPIFSKDTLVRYMIRFQNTGQDTAYNLVIKDTIDHDLDLSSLQLNMSSHPFQLEIEGDNCLRFLFNGIKLPPAIQDSTNSQLAFSFSLRPRSDIEYGSLIKNSAELVVDFESPLYSNEVVNLLSEKDLTLNGFVLTEGVKPVKGVSAELSGASSQFAQTNAGGLFTFHQLVPEQNYQLHLEKLGGLLNGVTTFDLLQIQKHILGVEPFGSPFRKLAADINDSGSITTADIIELRKLILGIISEFPNNDSWRFVSSDYDLPPLPPAQVNEIPDTLGFTLSGSSSQMFFIGLKVGDVTGDVDPQNLQDGQAGDTRVFSREVDWVLEDKWVSKGEKVLVPVLFGEQNPICAFQFSMAYGENDLFLEEVLPGTTELTSFDAVVHHVPEGKVIAFSSFHTSSFVEEARQPTAYLQFKAKREGYLSDFLKLQTHPTPALAYNKEGEKGKIQLRWQRKELHIGDVQPNPFNKRAIIPVFSPEEGEAELRVWAPQGQMLLQRRFFLEGGKNGAIPLERNDLGAAGTYFWQLTCGEKQYSGRFIVVD
jgi:hypothetical protein